MLDLRLPESAGLPTLRRVSEASPQIPIVVMVRHEEEHLGVRALQQGAEDYLLKDALGQSLILMVFGTAAGRGQTDSGPRGSRHEYGLAREQVVAFMEEIDWETNSYAGSHRGAGLGSVAALAPDCVYPEWFDLYFEYCDSMFDPNNGMMGSNIETQYSKYMSNHSG